MRILVVTHYWPPHIGGVETVAYEQARRIAVKGYDVTVFTSRVPRNTPEYSEEDHVKVFRAPAINLLEDKFGIPYPIFAFNALNTLRELVRRVDIVHVHEAFYHSSYFALNYAKKYGKPSIVTMHISKRKFGSTILNLAGYCLDLIERDGLRKTSLIIGVSRKTLNSKGVKGIVLYNGVDHEKFRPPTPKEKEELRRKLGIPPERMVALYVGRIARISKGVDILVEAMEILEKKRSNVFFLIAGGGVDENWLRREIALRKLRNVKYLGQIEYRSLPEIYMASDIAVFPYRTGEGMPMTLLEALSTGLPVVTTRVKGGHLEIVRDKYNGLLADFENPEDLALKIELLEANPSLVAEMSLNNRRVVEEKYTWDINVKMLQKIYEGVLSR